jgi:hypothetical protein
MPEKDLKIGRIKWSKYDETIQAVRGIIETYEGDQQELPFMIKQEVGQYKYQEGRMVQFVKNDEGVIPKADDIDLV